MSEDSEKEKGNAAFRSGDYAIALKHYDQAIKNAGSGACAPLFSNKAAALQKLEKYDLCIEQCFKGLAAPGLTPELKSKINFRILLAYEAQGKFEEAIGAIENCEMSPTVMEKMRELIAKLGNSKPQAFHAFMQKTLQAAGSLGVDTGPLASLVDRIPEISARRQNVSSGARPKLTRPQLIAEHSRFLECQQAGMLGTPVGGPIRFDTLNSGPSGRVCTALLCDLDPITIGQLRLDEANAGKLLICRTIAEPLFGPRVETLIEDPTGEATRLAIYNLRSPTIGDKYLVPLGTYLAIKEPWYQTGDNFHTVRIDNPANMVYLAQHHPLSSNLKWQTDPSGSPGSWNSFQRRANELFVAGNYELAVAVYTDAIELKREVAPSELADLLADRAAAYLKAENPSDAVGDCQSALHLKPEHLKAALRLAKAHATLEEYEKAKEILEASPHTTRPEFKNEISRLIRLICEQQNGDYDLESLLKEAAASKTPRLDHANFNGGVGKKWISQEKGNGLIALRDFAPGDLLFVEKAFEIAFSQRNNNTTTQKRENRSLADFWTADVHSECVSRIIRRISKNTDLIKEFYQLFAGPHFARLENSVTSDALAVDSKRVAAIVNSNAFGSNAFNVELFGRGRPTLDSTGAGFSFDGCGVWILASSMNHSCVPNNVVFYVGDLMIVRAAKPIREGDELTTSYTHYAQDYAKRQAVLAKYGFKCECELCVCDLKRIGNQPNLDEQRQAFMHLFDKVRYQLEEAAESRSPSLVMLTEVVRQLVQEFLSRLSYKDRYDVSLGRLFAALGRGYERQGERLKAAAAYEQAYFAAVGNQGNMAGDTFISNTLSLDAFMQSYNIANNILLCGGFNKTKEYVGKLRQAAKICWGSDDQELLEMLFPEFHPMHMLEALYLITTN